MEPSPGTLAVTALVPGLAASVSVARASPSWPVVTITVVPEPLSVPEPLVTVNVTCTFETGLPFPSTTRTSNGSGNVVPAVAVWPYPHTPRMAVNRPPAYVGSELNGMNVTVPTMLSPDACGLIELRGPSESPQKLFVA